MNQMKQTDVLIDGRVYSISGQENEEYLQRVARFVNDTIQEVRKLPGYKRLDDEYQALLLNLNLADAYFKQKEALDKLSEEAEEKERELYNLKHDMVSTQMKLEAALRQQDRLGERCEEWKRKYEELHREGAGVSARKTAAQRTASSAE